MTIREITDEIGALYERMKAAVAKATEAGAPMSKEEEEQYQKNNNRLTDLIKMRDQHYLLLDAQAKATNTRGLAIQQMAEERSLTPKQERRLGKFLDGEEYRSAFLSYLTKGLNGLSGDEQRAMSEGTNADGGFLPATEFYNQLIKKRFLTNGMRQVASVMPLGTFKTDIVLESTFATASYESEAASKTESSGQFSNVVLQPYTMRVFSRVSNELLADAPTRGPGFSIESILADQFGRVMGEKEEEAFVTGDGSGKPSGILSYTASFGGGAITKVTTATNNVIVAQDLLNVVYSLPRQYRQNAKWVMTDTMFSKIRALLRVSAVTTTTSGAAGGNYSPFDWSMGDGRLQDGEPDRLLGYPVVCVAKGPDFPAAGTARIMAAFGDFSYYHIGDRESISIKVARETYLANNQTGFFAFARHDGKASQLEAFRHLEIKGS
jgi:HK97 family phage major capsid protein